MVYLAAPFGEPLSDKRNNALNAKKILENKGMTVFCPWEYMIPHAYEYPNNEWGQMVFINDVKALDGADIVLFLLLIFIPHFLHCCCPFLWQKFHCWYKLGSWLCFWYWQNCYHR